jgi:GNAT superfamily N-acetyltransferase
MALGDDVPEPRRYRPTVIRELTAKDAKTCDAIVAGLPDWFGDPMGLAECVEAVRSQNGYVAEASGEVVGFLTWIERDRATVEITWMAVRSDSRRRGYGRALVEALIGSARGTGASFVLVKTLSDTHPDEGYAQTRAFYRNMGFDPIAELDIWGPRNPAQLLMRLI